MVDQSSEQSPHIEITPLSLEQAEGSIRNTVKAWKQTKGRPANITGAATHEHVREMIRLEEALEVSDWTDMRDFCKKQSERLQTASKQFSEDAELMEAWQQEAKMYQQRAAAFQTTLEQRDQKQIRTDTVRRILRGDGIKALNIAEDTDLTRREILDLHIEQLDLPTEAAGLPYPIYIVRSEATQVDPAQLAESGYNPAVYVNYQQEGEDARSCAIIVPEIESLAPAQQESRSHVLEEKGARCYDQQDLKGSLSSRTAAVPYKEEERSTVNSIRERANPLFLILAPGIRFTVANPSGGYPRRNSCLAVFPE